jgi:hypothetical protein
VTSPNTSQIHVFWRHLKALMQQDYYNRPINWLP